MLKKQLSVKLSRTDARLLESEAARQRIPLTTLIRSRLEPLLKHLRQRGAGQVESFSHVPDTPPERNRYRPET